MKTARRFLILVGAFTIASMELQAQQPVKTNEFKIGMFGCSFMDSAHTGVPYVNPTIMNGQNQVNTSTLNVIAEDGFNIVQTYYPDEWSSENMMRAALKAFNRHKLQVHLGAMGYYKPDVSSTASNPFGENTYDNCGYSYQPNMSPYYSHMFRPNYVDLFNNVYSDPQFRKTIWGFHVCEEASYYHCYDFTCGPAAQSYQWQDPNYFKNTEVPPANVREAVDYFKGAASVAGLNAKTVLMEARHGGRIDDHLNDGEGIYNPQDYIHLIDKSDNKEVFFEGSYTRFNINEGNSWMNNSYQAYENNYLGPFRSIDYARNYTDQVHKVLNIEGTKGDGWRRYNYWRHFHTDSLITNANWLWFQAYTSIIHKVKGVWFWDVRYSWNEGESQPSSNNMLRFMREKFPQTYRNYVSYLAKEMRYLVNNNVISTDANTIVATKTDQADPNSIVPAINTYLPASLNDAEHRSEHYGLRYTIRCNGKKTYMIITNPLNAPLRNIELNFSKVANLQIQNSTGVKVLFDNNANDVASTSYKTNRNSLVDLQNNTVGHTYTINYANANTKKLKLNFGPLDVKVLEFISNVPNHNNGWNDEWSNFGSGWIDGHNVNDADSFLIGDFDGDGAEELFCVSGVNSWMTVLKYTNNDWEWYWSNYGEESAGAGIYPYRNNLTVGDFDGDGKDEVLGCNAGWVTVFKYHDGDWHWYWSNYGNTSISITPYNQFYAGDFNGDGRDELMCYAAPDGWTTMFRWNGNGFSWVWSDYGSNHAITPYRSHLVVGDYDGDGKDELLGISGWNTMFHFENDDWQWGWSCYGTNSFGPITPTTPSVFVAGNVDNDRKDELFVLPTQLSFYSGAISNYARLLELANNQNSWNSNWTPSVAFIDDWPITNSVLNTTKYYFIKAKANSPAYLLAFRKFGNNYLVNMYSKTARQIVDFPEVGERNEMPDVRLSDENSSENTVLLYPNPTTGLFSVESADASIVTVQILNMVGLEVFRKDCAKGTHHVDVDLTGQKTGIYLVKVTDDKEMVTVHQLSVKK